MSGNAYSNLWKYTVTGSEKRFKVSTLSETRQHQSQITKIILTSEKD